MKQYISHAIRLSIFLLVITISNSSCLRKRITYGKVVTHTMNVNAFDSMEVSGNASVTLFQGKEYKVVVKAPKKVQNLVYVSATKGKLFVKVNDLPNKNPIIFNRNTNPITLIKVFVIVPSLTNIAIYDNADFYINNHFKAKKLEIKVLDNAACNVKQLYAKEVKVSVTDNADAYFERFNVINSDIKVTSNADIDIKYVDAETSIISTSDNASAILNGKVKQGIKTFMSGNSSIQNKVNNLRDNK